MATTLMPLDPATSPQRATRVLRISADLMPEEIVAARRAHSVRGRVIVLLVVVVVLLGSWYGFAYFATAQAEDELAALTTESHVLQQQHRTRYADVVGVRNATNEINRQLGTLLANDLKWANLFDTLRTTGSQSGIEIAGMSGNLATADAVAAALPSTTNAKVVGSLVLTGTAPDKVSLAKFVDALGALDEVANPYLSSATEAENSLQFSLKVDITSDALGGRFSTTPTGGK